MSARKLYNKDASANNTMVIHEDSSNCCGSDRPLCMYTRDLNGGNYSGIRVLIDGVSQDITWTPTTDEAVIVANIKEGLKGLGVDPNFDDDYAGVKVINQFLMITADVDISHIGVFDGSTTWTAIDKRCTKTAFSILSFTITYNEAFTVTDPDGTSGGTYADQTATESIDGWSGVYTQLGDTNYSENNAGTKNTLTFMYEGNTVGSISATGVENFNNYVFPAFKA